MLKDGRALVIMNELVLDMDGYIGYHPGGRFVLERNIGRDISKFYCGSYSILEDNSIKMHNHGKQADWQVYQMIIGHCSGQLKGAETHLVKKVTQALANETTGTFRLDTVSKDSKHQYRDYYSDLSNIGLYYVIYEKNNPTKKRQYTICNALIPNVRKAAIELMENAIR